MFHFIIGKVAAVKANFAVLQAGNVGYKITVGERTAAALSAAQSKNEEAKLFTHLAVREDGIELFGFGSEAELDAFLLLTGVSGVGPKGAISVLSQLTPEQFMMAVCTEDKKTISRASGIGPKIAARIILELHDKLAATGGFAVSDAAPALPLSPAAPTSALSEAQEALLVLGYTRPEILTALHTIDPAGKSAEDIIRLALKKLIR